MMTSSIRSGASLARARAAPITWAPSLCAVSGDNSPMKRPNGVRVAERMTTGSERAGMTASPAGLLYDDSHLYIGMQCKVRGSRLEPHLMNRSQFYFRID